jgi:hypothetical protein
MGVFRNGGRNLLAYGFYDVLHTSFGHPVSKSPEFVLARAFERRGMIGQVRGSFPGLIKIF